VATGQYGLRSSVEGNDNIAPWLDAFETTPPVANQESACAQAPLHQFIAQTDQRVDLAQDSLLSASQSTHCRGKGV
jgi:hypothetical protein